jgi:Flp pilus assembly pilin Flp
MMNLVKKLVRDESAQDLAEYGIALALIAVGAGVIAVAIGTQTNVLWSNAQTAVNNAVTAEAA